MDIRTRSKLKMANAVLQFAANHPVVDGGFTTIVTRLKDDVDAMNTLATKARASQTTELAATARRHEVRQAVVRRYLRRLRGIAVVAAATHPELPGMFPPAPVTGPDRVLLDAARVMLTDALAQKDVLVSLGIGDAFFDEFGAALAEFDIATSTGGVSRTDHVGSNAQLKRLGEAAAAEVRLLNTFMQAVYAGNAEVLAGWASAKRTPIPNRDDVIVVPVGDAAGGSPPAVPPVLAVA
jgi:hypothetical protein